MELQELKYILEEGESQYIEFKREFPKQADDIAKEIVAFANSSGGILFVGIDDNGEIIGVADPLQIDDRLSGLARNCQPPLSIIIGRVQMMQDKTIVYAKIPYSPIHTYQERAYIRVGTRCQKAFGKDIEQLINIANRAYVKLKPDSDNISRIKKSELRNKAWKGYFIISISTITYFAIVIYDILVSSIIFLTGYHLIGLILMVGCFVYFFKSYLEAAYLYFKRPKNTTKAIFIGNGRFMEDDSKENYAIYKPTARCIYPCCNQGKIIVTAAPPREISRIGKDFIGLCSVGGKDHSYRLDDLLVATPEYFDWRSLQQK